MLFRSVAGGFYASMNDYVPLLAVAFHRGQYRGERFIAANLVDEMGRAPNPNASVGTSPMARFATPPFRYGLAAWLECATPTAFASGCNSQSSPGAFGFTPWFDRDAGYYAMIGMYQLGRATDTRVFEFSATLAQQLKPAIREAMAAR